MYRAFVIGVLLGAALAYGGGLRTTSMSKRIRMNSIAQSDPSLLSGSLLVGLESFYNLDTTALDSLNHFSGAPTDAVYQLDAGIINEGLVLNGTSTKIITAGDPLTVWSVSMWVRPLSTGGDRPLFQSAGGNPGYYLKSNGTTDWFNGSSHFSSLTAADGAWTFLVVTFDGTTIQTYFNSVADTPIVTTGAFTLSNFGWNGGAVYAAGAFDAMGVWTRVITPAEVATLYRGGLGQQYPPMSLPCTPLVLNADTLAGDSLITLFGSSWTPPSSVCGGIFGVTGTSFSTVSGEYAQVCVIGAAHVVFGFFTHPDYGTFDVTIDGVSAGSFDITNGCVGAICEGGNVSSTIAMPNNGLHTVRATNHGPPPNTCGIFNTTDVNIWKIKATIL